MSILGKARSPLALVVYRKRDPPYARPLHVRYATDTQFVWPTRPDEFALRNETLSHQDHAQPRSAPAIPRQIRHVHTVRISQGVSQKHACHSQGFLLLV
jgi:hypothetical protein